MEIVADFTDPSPHGTCLADAQLNGTLDSKPLESFSLSPAGVAVWEVTVPGVASGQPPKLVACVMEFDVSGVIGDVAFQTYVTTSTGNRPTFTAQVEPDDGLHVRGWWPRSAMKIKMNPEDFNVNPTETNPPNAKCGVCEQQPPSVAPELDIAQGFGKQNGSGHTFDTANVGAYGVNLSYTGNFINLNPTITGHGFITMRRQNVVVGGANAKYWGAARPMAPWLTARVPKIHRETDVNNANAVDLLQYRNPVGPNYIAVPPNAGAAGGGPKVAIQVDIANGGAAALPVGIYRFRANILTQPVEEGG
ncbi:MAG: hypothetical protein ABL949_13930 [Fimbriimonadaceae bacterium]